MALDSSKVFSQHLRKINLTESTYTAATSLLSTIDTIQMAFEGNHISNEQAYVLGWRSNLSNNIAGAAGFIGSSWLDLMDVIDIETGADPALTYRESYDWMHANSVYFLTRGMTITPGTISGTKGVLKTWTVDYRNYPMENACPGTYTIKCVGDMGLGDIPGAETFNIKSQTSGIDWLDSVAQSRVPPSQINVKHCQLDSMLLNSSFEGLLDPGSVAGTGTIGTTNSQMVNWSITAGTITNMGVSRNTYYDWDNISGANYNFGLSLVLLGTTGTIGIEQDITQQYSQAFPYYAGIQYYRGGTAALGTLGITHGTVSNTVDISTVAASTWTTLELPQDSSSWYNNFKPSSGYPKFKIAFTAATNNTSVLHIDHCNLFPPDLYGNVYLALIGQSARFQLDDTLSLAVAYTTTGRRQKWEAVLNNVYFPSASASSVSGCLADS